MLIRRDSYFNYSAVDLFVILFAFIFPYIFTVSLACSVQTSVEFIQGVPRVKVTTSGECSLC